MHQIDARFFERAVEVSAGRPWPPRVAGVERFEGRRIKPTSREWNEPSDVLVIVGDQGREPRLPTTFVHKAVAALEQDGIVWILAREDGTALQAQAVTLEWLEPTGRA